MAFLLALHASIGIAKAIDRVEPEVIEYENVRGIEVEIVTYIDFSKEGRIEEEIAEYFPEDITTAIAIAKCESNLVPDAQSQHILSYGREQSYGLFQIHAPDWGATAQSLGLKKWKTDVVENITLARHIYDVSGWGAWTCYDLI